jgi:hypothetical protein
VPPPGFRVGAPRAVSPRAIDVLSPATFFVDGPVTYSQPFMTRPVEFIGVTWGGFSRPGWSSGRQRATTLLLSRTLQPSAADNEASKSACQSANFQITQWVSTISAARTA